MTRNGCRNPQASLEADIPQFAEQISALLDRGDRLVGSGVQLVGVDRIKASLGAAWPRRAEQIIETTTRIIRQHLAPQDLLMRLGETQFLIVFSNIDPEHAKLKCGLISKAILDRLEGENDLSSIEVRTVVKEIDGSLGLQTDRLDNLITGMLSKPSSDTDPATRPDPATDTAGRDLFESFEELSIERIAFVYREILDVRRRAVVSFRAVPYWIGALGRRYEDYALVDAFDGPAEKFVPSLDLCQIRHTIEAMVRYAKSGHRALFVTSVHFLSLSHLASRTNLIGLLSRIPVDLKSYLIINIDGLPDGVPSSRISEFVGALKAHCRHVTISIGISASTIGLTSGSGAFAVTVDANGPIRERQAIRKINKLANQSDKLGLKIGIRGIRSSSMLLNCIAAGCEWIEGPTIGAPVASPPPATRFSWREWYKAKTET